MVSTVLEVVEALHIINDPSRNCIPSIKVCGTMKAYPTKEVIQAGGLQVLQHVRDHARGMPGWDSTVARKTQAVERMVDVMVRAWAWQVCTGCVQCIL